MIVVLMHISMHLLCTSVNLPGDAAQAKFLVEFERATIPNSIALQCVNGAPRDERSDCEGPGIETDLEDHASARQQPAHGFH